MNLRKMFARNVVGGFTLALVLSASAPAQNERTLGGSKGRVRVDGGSTPGGVMVIVRRGDDEVKRVETKSRGEFEVLGLEPGLYGLTFRKPGLSVGRMENVEERQQ